jgi:hypothetical protein
LLFSFFFFLFLFFSLFFCCFHAFFLFLKARFVFFGGNVAGEEQFTDPKAGVSGERQEGPG